MVEVQDGSRSRLRREKVPVAAGSTAQRPGRADPAPTRGRKPASSSGRWIGSPPLLVAALLVAVVLVIIGVSLCIQNWTRGVPWTPRLTLLIATNWCAVLLGLGVGLWWWWRAPANPTGRLLYVAGLCLCCETISRSWPGSLFPYLVGLPGLLTVPCLAIIVFGWPTGRPSHRLFRLVVCYGVTVAAIFVVGEVFQKSTEPTPDWPDAPQAIFALPQVWAILDAFQALALNAVPAVATIIWLIRRRRAVPPAVRPLITPITAAGVLVAGSMVFVHFGFQVFGSLFDADGDDIGTARLLALLGNYFMVGFVALGVLVAATKRRRAVAVGSRQMLVDLRSATPVVSPSAAAAAIVDDPTAKVRYRGSDGGWIDSSGAALADLDLDRRRLLPIFDDTGREIAGLEVSAATPVPPLLVDLAVSAISARAANERATAQADARRREVRARSRDLVAAADAGRVDLERDLHDGAQQLLVGLALTSGLRVRTSTSAVELAAASADTVEAIEHVRREVLALVDSATPAALSRGLAAALRSLAAVCPINSSLHAAGDVDADDPLALGLYLAAGEAITNAVKHSGASRIDISLQVLPGMVRLDIEDDGIGGVGSVPHSIAERVAELAGITQVDSPPMMGTALRIDLPRGEGEPR